MFAVLTPWQQLTFDIKKGHLYIKDDIDNRISQPHFIISYYVFWIGSCFLSSSQQFGISFFKALNILSMNPALHRRGQVAEAKFLAQLLPVVRAFLSHRSPSLLDLELA